MNERSTPPGWYDDGQGKQRWWSGQRWSISWIAANEPSRHRLPRWVVVAAILVGALVVFAVGFYLYEADQAWNNAWNDLTF